VIADCLHLSRPTGLSQANMMPQLAAVMWPTLEAAAAKYSLRLGSPSAAGCGAWWVQQPAACVVRVVTVSQMACGRLLWCTCATAGPTHRGG
jgi:Glycosyl hydrolase catalytic core